MTCESLYCTKATCLSEKLIIIIIIIMIMHGDSIFSIFKYSKDIVEKRFKIKGRFPFQRKNTHNLLPCSTSV
jgi:hypothetical protein